MKRIIVSVLIFCLFVGVTLTLAFGMPREPQIDILDGPAYAVSPIPGDLYPIPQDVPELLQGLSEQTPIKEVQTTAAQADVLNQYLTSIEKSALSINPQILGSIDITDTTTLPGGTILHAGGDKWTLTCTYLTYRQERTRDMNGYASWAGLHWGVYELVQTSTPVAQIVNGKRWEFGWTAGYPKQLIVCAIDLNRFTLRRDSPALDNGAYWYDTFTYDSPNIWKSSPNILHDPEVVTFDRWVVEGTRKATKAGLIGAGDWYWDRFSTVYVYSTAEPSTVRIGKAVDFNGNPIVGVPDRGAIEYQPGWP